MNNVLRIVSVLFVFSALLSGCVTRRYVAERPRQDMSVEGNRGYLSGTPSSYTESADLLQRRERLGDTRQIHVLEIDIPATQGTEGETGSGVCTDFSAPVSRSGSGDTVLFQEPVSYEQESLPKSADTKDKIQTVTTSYSKYTVQKNDTLQKISSKFYGTTSKWTKLFKENKDIIKSPDKLRAGMVIKIPLLKSLK